MKSTPHWIPFSEPLYFWDLITFGTRRNWSFLQYFSLDRLGSKTWSPQMKWSQRIKLVSNGTICCFHLEILLPIIKSKVWECQSNLAICSISILSWQISFGWVYTKLTFDSRRKQDKEKEGKLSRYWGKGSIYWELTIVTEFCIFYPFLCHKILINWYCVHTIDKIYKIWKTAWLTTKSIFCLLLLGE